MARDVHRQDPDIPSGLRAAAVRDPLNISVGGAEPRRPVTFVDYGSDMFITGATDSRWNNDELNPAFRSLTAGDFEVVRLSWR